MLLPKTCMALAVLNIAIATAQGINFILEGDWIPTSHW